MTEILTNRKIANESEKFQRCCRKANCRASTRQASKFVNGKGIAYKVYMKRALPLLPGMAGYFEHKEVMGNED